MPIPQKRAQKNKNGMNHPENEHRFQIILTPLRQKLSDTKNAVKKWDY